MNKMLKLMWRFFVYLIDVYIFLCIHACYVYLYMYIFDVYIYPYISGSANENVPFKSRVRFFRGPISPDISLHAI